MSTSSTDSERFGADTVSNSERPSADTVVGFTGTRRGMTTAQTHTVANLLGADHSIVTVHHGDCVGADADCHQIAMSEGVSLVIHPPSDAKLRAFCHQAYEPKVPAAGVTVEVLDPKPYHDRNRDIVNASHWLIATPQEDREQDRGGTWWTIRYARQQGKTVVIIWPDGTTQSDGRDDA